MEQKKDKGIFHAAGMIMIAMTLSRLFGYVRDVVIFTNFGQDYRTDAYLAAFTIPDFLYYMLVGGALSSAFIPVFSSYIATQKEQEGWIVANTILNLVLMLASIGIVLGIIFAPFLVKMLVPGFEQQAYELTVLLTRVMFAQMFFMCLNGLSQGVLHSYKQFFAPALGSVLYNVAIIVVGILLMKNFGILGFSIGVVTGAFLNFAVQIPTLLKIGYRYIPVINLKHPGVKKILVLIGPVFIGLAVTDINLFISQFLVSSLGEGLLSSLKAAQRIMQLPIGIFAIAVAMAVFPVLTGHAARNENEQFRSTLALGFRTVIFVTLPAAVGLAVLSVPIVRAMYLQGEFTVQNMNDTALALVFYSVGLIGYSAQQVLNRGFYAVQDTKTPVTLGIVSIVVNIILNVVLVEVMGFTGLALAYSLAGLASMVLLLYYLRKRVGSIGGRRIVVSFIKTILAAAIMAIVVNTTAGYLEGALDMTNKMMQITQVLIAVVVGALSYGIAAFLMKMEETELVLDIVKRKLKRK